MNKPTLNSIGGKTKTSGPVSHPSPSRQLVAALALSPPEAENQQSAASTDRSDSTAAAATSNSALPFANQQRRPEPGEHYSLLPFPVDQASAEILVSEGLESYYTTLGAWRYLAREAERQADNDCQRAAIAALYCESFDPEEQYRSATELGQQLEAQGFDYQQQTKAFVALVQSGVLKARSVNNQRYLATNLPEHGQLLPPWTLDYNARLALLEEYGLENTYLALGQAAARWQQAQQAVDSPLARSLLTRLYSEFQAAESDYDHQLGLSIDQLTFGIKLSTSERQEIEQHLDNLVDQGLLRRSEQWGRPIYAPPVLTDLDPKLVDNEQQLMLTDPYINHVIAGDSLEHLWRFQGRVEQGRQHYLAQAENDAERCLVEHLAQLQEQNPGSGGFSRQHLLTKISEQLGAQHPAEVETLLDSSPVYQRLKRQQRGSREFVALVADDDKQQSVAAFAAEVSVQRRAELLLGAGTVQGYYRALGRGVEIERHFAQQLAADRKLVTAEIREMWRLFTPGLIDPEQRWQPIGELSKIFSAGRVRSVCQQLVNSGVLIERTVPIDSDQGTAARQETLGRKEYALAEDPFTD